MGAVKLHYRPRSRESLEVEERGGARWKGWVSCSGEVNEEEEEEDAEEEMLVVLTV